VKIGSQPKTKIVVRKNKKKVIFDHEIAFVLAAIFAQLRERCKTSQKPSWIPCFCTFKFQIRLDSAFLSKHDH